MGTSRDADTMAAHRAGTMAADAVRNPYSPPTLARLGNLRGATLGGTPGAGDSGAGAEFQNFNGGFDAEYRWIP